MQKITSFSIYLAWQRKSTSWARNGVTHIVTPSLTRSYLNNQKWEKSKINTKRSLRMSSLSMQSFKIIGSKLIISQSKWQRRYKITHVWTFSRQNKNPCVHNLWKNHHKIVDIMRNIMQKTSSHLDNYSLSYDFLNEEKKFKKHVNKACVNG
jgi:hypothetical protein